MTKLTVLNQANHGKDNIRLTTGEESSYLFPAIVRTKSTIPRPAEAMCIGGQFLIRFLLTKKQ